MRQIRIAKRRRGQAGWRQARLPPDPGDPRDPRDPDIVHAHRAARRSSRSVPADRSQPDARALSRSPRPGSA